LVSKLSMLEYSGRKIFLTRGPGRKTIHEDGFDAGRERRYPGKSVGVRS
jgi:hypothetical protein